jgi:GDP-4-dehydro-6-deoxy-D-mannose reductase
MQEILDRLLALAKVKVAVRQEANLLRTRETDALRADAGKLRRATGWEPRYSLEQTLTDILNYWRSVV